MFRLFKLEIRNILGIGFKRVVYLTSSYVNWDFFGMSGPRVPEKAQFTHE
jgi:hypothetical protein